MTTEEKAALLKAMGVDFGKTEIVFEKNVEYEIGNVEAGGIGVQVNHGAPTARAGAGKSTAAGPRPKTEAFRMVSEVFTYKWTRTHPRRVTDFYQCLLKLHAIDRDTSHEEFEKLFTGVPTDVTVKWTAPKSALKFLMSTLKERGYIEPAGKIWVITESHFKDANDRLFQNMRNEHNPEYLADVIGRIADTLDPDKDVPEIRMIDDDTADELWSGIRDRGYGMNAMGR